MSAGLDLSELIVDAPPPAIAMTQPSAAVGHQLSVLRCLSDGQAIGGGCR
jgi:hypothetical protein